jgi:hypothetical protein
LIFTLAGGARSAFEPSARLFIPKHIECESHRTPSARIKTQSHVCLFTCEGSRQIIKTRRSENAPAPGNTRSREIIHVYARCKGVFYYLRPAQLIYYFNFGAVAARRRLGVIYACIRYNAVQINWPHAAN